jgi:CDP-glycerol glycerophosphotransferase (TagB/SpsB family)
MPSAKWGRFPRLPVRRLIRSTLDHLIAFVPKREQVLLNLYPDTDASLPPLLEACRGVETRVVVLLTDPGNAVATRVRDALGDRAAVYRRGSVGAAWHYARSKHVIFTHPAFVSRRLASRQTVVNIWHGMPIKAFGRLDRPQPRVLAHWTLASSELFRAPMAEALGVPTSSVVILNSPRLEHLARSHRDVWDKLGIDRSRWERVVVWMPTYRGRQADEGGTGVEHPPLMSADGMLRLGKLLAHHRCLLVLRRHPYEAQAAPISVPDVVELTDTVLEAAGAGIYDVLAESDGLVSDVSSVLLDYLVLDRPVIVYFPDHESYTADRRLVLDPYDRWAPGPVIQTEENFLDALDAVATGTDLHRDRRSALRQALVGDDVKNLSARVLELAGVRLPEPVGAPVAQEPGEKISSRLPST